MKLSISTVAAAFLAVAYATPILVDFSEEDLAKAKAFSNPLKVRGIKSRQNVGTTANEFTNGGCRDVIFIFARGSTQDGNMGDMPGPQTANALKSALGASKVAAQGVDYKAGLLTNLYPGGCDPDEAASMTALITRAATQCPSSNLVVAGYSQGAAMVHRSLEAASAAVQARVSAAVTYGDTQKKQDGGRIPNFDVGKTLILCNDGDRVCEGTLIITPAHSDYTGSVASAVSFMQSKL